MISVVTVNLIIKTMFTLFTEWIKLTMPYKLPRKLGHIRDISKNTANEKTYFHLYEQVKAKLKEEPFRFELPYFISKLQAFV